MKNLKRLSVTTDALYYMHEAKIILQPHCGYKYCRHLPLQGLDPSESISRKPNSRSRSLEAPTSWETTIWLLLCRKLYNANLMSLDRIDEINRTYWLAGYMEAKKPPGTWVMRYPQKNDISMATNDPRDQLIYGKNNRFLIKIRAVNRFICLFLFYIYNSPIFRESASSVTEYEPWL